MIIITDDCIKYPYLNRDGYGHVQYRENGIKKHYLAHRLSYELHNKVSLSPTQVVMHTCDNPCCINPKHLIKTTHTGNVADKVSKNRQARGIKNGRAKLTDSDVRFIRNSTISNYQLAIRFNIDRKAIRDVKSFKTWRHIT